MATKSIGDQLPLVVIVGPTASGKTDLAIRLAQQVDGEIISADSRTIYKHMDIGTAKPTVPERQGVRHHMLDVIEPDQRFSVADFQRTANEIVHDIRARGRIPIMVGGSGMYVDAVIYNYDFATDPDRAERDQQNPRHMAPGVGGNHTLIRKNVILVGLIADPTELEARMARRIDTMFSSGLVTEASALSEKYGWDIEPMKTYLPIRDLLNGTSTEQEAKQKMLIKDRQVAKKQRTWFRRNNSIHWEHDPSKIVDFVTTKLNKQS